MLDIDEGKAGETAALIRISWHRFVLEMRCEQRIGLQPRSRINHSKVGQG